MNSPKTKVVLVRDQDQDIVPHQSAAKTFQKISARVASKLGSVWAFFLALLIIITWALTGPIFDFSNTWQLIINTGTTIVTFLMVFVIQNTQNRDGKAIQIKLDELIKAQKGARTEFVNIEELSEHELDELNEQFKIMHHRLAERSARREARKLDEDLNN